MQKWLVLVIAAIGCNGGIGGGKGGGGDASVVDVDAAAAGSDAAVSNSCTSTAQCSGGRVCNPATSICVDDLACDDHGDCGLAAFCDDDGSCAPSKTGSPCSTSDNCGFGETCTGGFCGCDGETFAAESVPPNVLIVLDRSSSMNNNISGSDSKWEIAHDAIADLLAEFGDQIRFGLALYPGTNQSCSQGGNCNAGKVFVDPGEDTASAINTFLASANTCNFGTPTAAMLESLAGDPSLTDTSRPNYVLLITDGQSSCSDDPADEVAALRNETPEVKTFVVGFGSGVDPDELDDMATAGGTAIAGGPPFYFVAGDAASLEAAFNTIAGSVLSCTYTLSGTPSDPNQLFVYQDGTEVARDQTQTNGWDYDATNNQVTFFGPSCTALQSGTVTDLVIVFGCPIVID